MMLLKEHSCEKEETMDQTTLRKVQLVQLEIAKEVKRVCDENDITYWKWKQPLGWIIIRAV